MSNKYVIKNCPACYSILGKEEYICDLYNDRKCQDCTDCVLKRIVELCKDAKSECSCKNPNPDIDCFECTSGGRADMAKEILQLLEIEEVE